MTPRSIDPDVRLLAALADLTINGLDRLTDLLAPAMGPVAVHA